ncbi:MspA family porin [Rhodococcus triatomae]|uniref:MspA protein n=1 Tax=Rhodococcus triatomae TaxID=300028 RepID=A0A1G8AAI0_9NOCA|nr:MspA family porin [Rhodococcus triatomae]QNG17821.1 MspA family porin [Rhodococcus triatomae]QNG22511.1 MspA family porin [Rhodococcus triatomae]SDH17836.1 MspA protein [Rhodococcus triatomae]
MNSKTLRHGAKAAAVVGSATVAIGLFSTGAAHADTFVPLQDGEVTQTLLDGTVVTVKQTGNTALINPSLGSTPLHRNVWASGTVDVTLSGGSAKGGTIDAGYIVACQLNFGGSVNGGAEQAVGNAQQGWEAGVQDPKANAGAGITIGPGEATAVSILDIEYEDSYGAKANKSNFSFTGNSGGFTYADETFGVSGCAGYAQARSYVKVNVSTDSVDGNVTLWGQPFSLG